MTGYPFKLTIHGDIVYLVRVSSRAFASDYGTSSHRTKSPTIRIHPDVVNSSTSRHARTLITAVLHATFPQSNVRWRSRAAGKLVEATGRLGLIASGHRCTGYPFILVIEGADYLVRLARRDLGAGGDASPPHARHRTIRISRTIAEDVPTNHARLIIHEVLHALLWWLDEELVDMASREIAQALKLAGIIKDDSRYLPLDPSTW